VDVLLAEAADGCVDRKTQGGEADAGAAAAEGTDEVEADPLAELHAQIEAKDAEIAEWKVRSVL
jgi:hypothetical protein